MDDFHLTPDEMDVFDLVDSLLKKAPPQGEITERRRDEIRASAFAKMRMIEAGAMSLYHLGKLKCG